MAVKIRLRRTGKRNAPTHRIVVADGRSPRDGRFIEILGTYDPRGKVEDIDVERADYWVSHGAQPSETVAAIIKRAKAGIPMMPEGGPEETAPPAAEAAPETAAADTAEDTAEETAEAPSEAAADETAEESAETTDEPESASEPASHVEDSGDAHDQDDEKKADA